MSKRSRSQSPPPQQPLVPTYAPVQYPLPFARPFPLAPPYMRPPFDPFNAYRPLPSSLAPLSFNEVFNISQPLPVQKPLAPVAVVQRPELLKKPENVVKKKPNPPAKSKKNSTPRAVDKPAKPQPINSSASVISDSVSEILPWLKKSVETQTIEEFECESDYEIEEELDGSIVKGMTRNLETAKKIQRVVKSQFDLEILLKQHQIRVIKDEMESAKNLLKKLREGGSIPADPNVVYVSVDSIKPNTNTPNTQTPLPRKSEGADLIVRRDDNIFLQLTCPSCSRSNFGNMQGFVNHCRIVHKIEFAGHSEAVKVCGTVIDEDKVPADHEARSMQPIFKSHLSWWDVENESNIQDVEVEPLKPQIRVFEQEVDFESPENGKSHKKWSGMGRGKGIGRSHVRTIPIVEDDEEMESQSERNTEREETEDLRRYQNDETGSVNGPQNDGCSLGDDMSTDIPEALVNFNGNEVKGIIENAPADEFETFEEENIGIEKGKGREIADILFRQTAILNTLESNDTMTSDDNEIPVIENTEESENLELSDSLDQNSEAFTDEAPVILNASRSLVATGPRVPFWAAGIDKAVTQPTVEQNEPGESRFYIKKRIVVGNVSQWIIPKKRKKGGGEYKWMVYIRNPTSSDKLTTFIKKVRFYLHPDYKPFDVVDVTKPPFRLTRTGWGEFPIRLQLHFQDSERNRPVDIIHIIQLDKQFTGNQVIGSEKFFDIELDRNTDFDGAAILTLPETSVEVSGHKIEVKSTDQLAEFAIEKILNDSVRKYPLIFSGTISAIFASKLPYTVAFTESEFLGWPFGKQKSSEMTRARVILSDIQSHRPTKSDSAIAKAIDKLTLKSIAIWCRKNNHTPIPKNASEYLFSEPEQIRKFKIIDSQLKVLDSENWKLGSFLYCRYCGSAHALTGIRNEEYHQNVQEFNSVERKCRLNSPLKIVNKTLKLDSFSCTEFLDSLPDKVGNTDVAVKVFDKRLWAGKRHPSATAFDLEAINKTLTFAKIVKGPSYLVPSKLFSTEEWPDNVFVEDVIPRWQFKRVAASRGGVCENDEEQVKERDVTAGVMYQALKIFLSQLLKHSEKVFREEVNDDVKSREYEKSESTKVAPKKIMVPMHVWKAITRNENMFGFLSGQYMKGDG